MWLGVDTGGTFTDFVLYSSGKLQVHKVLSTPQAPEQAILQGIAELGIDEEQLQNLYVVHGSTVATNAVLEGKGVKTVYITNRGFADLLTIGRQTRQQLYNLQPQRQPPPVAKELCLETGGRLSAQGELIGPLTEEDLQAIKQQIEILQPQAVAINLLFSFLDDELEKRIEQVIPEHIFTSRSSTVLPEYKEYERGIATWLNAWVGPLVERYLLRLEQQLGKASLTVMQSSGGTMAAKAASSSAVNLLLSGPAGGLAGAHYLAKSVGEERILTFDMGGTSSDVAMIDGDITMTNEGKIGPYPVAVPMVDMHTIGAGGGSIARVDEGGLLQVGPESAGAMPGPVCYGQAGEQPTVTDANLILGRLLPDAFLGGGMKLDINAARHAIEKQIAAPLKLTIEQAAQGIIELANEHMARALRVMSVQRGVDARELTLVSFGGAGGLHVCALADALGMKKALVPVYGGVLSALGMLVAPRARRLSHAMNVPLQQSLLDAIETSLKKLAKQGEQELIEEGVAAEKIESVASLDLRYKGQSYTLNVAWTDIDEIAGAFHQLHEKRYGHRMPLEIEVVNVRLYLSAEQPPLQLANSQKIHGQTLQQSISADGIKVIERDLMPVAEVVSGPLLITELVATTYLAEGWSCYKEPGGSLILQA